MPDNYISLQEDKGSINISEEVIATMVASSVSEVEGVSGLATMSANELGDFLGKKSVAKGVRVTFGEEAVEIDVIILVKYGFEIKKVARDVQLNVVSGIEATTGLSVLKVNVHVAGVAFDR